MKIKGMNLQLGADTSELDKSFKSITDRSKGIQTQLKDVNKLLKFDPENVELLSQKQELLTQKIENSNEALKTLNEVQAKMNASGVSKTSDEYMALQREIEDTKISLSNLNKEATKTENALEEVSKKDPFAKLKTSITNFQNGLKDVGGKMQDFGGKLTANVTAPIAAGFALAVEGTKELRVTLSRLEVNADRAGISMEKTNEALRTLNGVSEDTGANVETLSNLMMAGLSENQMLEAIESLAGAVVAFPDTLKLEGLADGLQETLATGAAAGTFTELLERMGGNVETFNEGLEKAKKNGDATNYTLQELSKLGLADVHESFKTMNADQIEASNAAFDLQTNLAEIGAELEPIMTTIKGFVVEVLEWFNGLDDGSKATIGALVLIAAALGPVIGLVGTLTVAAGALGIAMGPFTAIIIGVVAGIAALVGIGVTLYKNWDIIKEKAGQLWQSIKDTFGKIGNFVKEIWKGITGAIKLPKFSIQGKFSILPPSVPSLKVNWYADGGIFNQPTLIPTMAGMMGVGEHRTGGEVVAPLKQLKSIIGEVVRANTSQPATIVNQFIVSGKQIASEIAPETDKVMGNIIDRSSRGIPR